MKKISDVVALVNELMEKEFTIVTMHGTQKISAKGIGYRFEFNNKKCAFGTCYYNQRKISLSLPLCSENLDKVDTNIQNTILHEIAHAFSVHVYGIRMGRGHGKQWKSIARQIGCNGERCFNGDAVNRPKSKYSLICDSCGYVSPKHRMVTRTYACAKCCNQHNGGKFTEKYKLRFVEN